MKLSTYNPNNGEEIEQLFIKTFSDTEGLSEGKISARPEMAFFSFLNGP